MNCLRGSTRLALRSFHTCPVRRIQHCEEVRIPVPWGHIAAKWWGSRDTQPILALHGWQDNAGTWDPLLKICPDNMSVLAVDFPGSGLSSHLPPFQWYHFRDAAVFIERIKRHYNFDEKMILLGHSGGSAACFYFSSVYPNSVKGFFGIDYLLYTYANHEKRAKSMGETIDKGIELALRDPLLAKRHKRPDAIKTWVTATKGSVTPASAEILMERGTMTLPDGSVVFTRDHRLKTNSPEPFSVPQAENLCESVSCHVSLIVASKSPLFHKGLKNAPHLLDIIRKRAASFELHKLVGGHHLHMDIPEVILPMFLDFLKKCG